MRSNYLLHGILKVYGGIMGTEQKESEAIILPEFPLYLSPQSRAQQVELKRKLGLLPPTKDGIITEGLQGFGNAVQNIALSAATAVDEITDWDAPKQAVRRFTQSHQHWNPYEGYTALSLNPVDMARTTGAALGYSMPITLPILAWFMVKRSKQLYRGYVRRRNLQGVVAGTQHQRYSQAVEELQSGNLEKSVWGMALAKSAGDEARAKAAYIKLRVANLRDAELIKLQSCPNVSHLGENIVTAVRQAQVNAGAVAHLYSLTEVTAGT